MESKSCSLKAKLNIDYFKQKLNDIYRPCIFKILIKVSGLEAMCMKYQHKIILIHYFFVRHAVPDHPTHSGRIWAHMFVPL